MGDARRKEVTILGGQAGLSVGQLDLRWGVSAMNWTRYVVLSKDAIIETNSNVSLEDASECQGENTPGGGQCIGALG